MLPTQNRLSKNSDFETLFKKGKTLKGDYLIVKILPNKKDFNRFGFVVSSKISKRAVVRNKIKRLLREIVKEHLPKIKKGFDVSIITLPGIEKESHHKIKENMCALFKKAKLVEDD